MATSAAVGIINAVFGSDATFGGAPKIENTTESIKSAWSFINSYEPRLNYFCNARFNSRSAGKIHLRNTKTR